MTLPIESVLTHPHGFGLTTASPLQRAICRIMDGLPLGVLGANAAVLEALGGADAVAALPTVAPAMVALLCSVRSAKTMIAAADAICATQRVDVSALKAGEVPRVSIVSVKVDLAKVAHRMICGVVTESPMLRRLLLDEPTDDTITLKHPTGRPIEIACVAGARAGNSLVSRWCAEAIFDEFPRMVGSEDGAVVNFDDMLAAVQARMLPRSRIMAIGSPWAPFGPAYRMATEHHGKPTADLVVIRGRGPLMNPSHFTDEFCSKLERTNPAAYQTDVLGNFHAAEAAPFPATACAESVGRSLENFRFHVPELFCDFSAGGRDSTAAMVGGWADHFIDHPWLLRKFDEHGNSLGGMQVFEIAKDGSYIRDPDKVPRPSMFVVHALHEREGGFWQKMSLDQVVDEVAAVGRKFNCRRAYGDGYERMGVEQSLRRHSIRFESLPWTNDTKASAVALLARIIAEGRLAIPDSELGRKLRDQLIRFRRTFSKLTGKPQFDGRRDDLVATLLNAMMLSGGVEHHGMAGSPVRSQNTVSVSGPGW